MIPAPRLCISHCSGFLGKSDHSPVYRSDCPKLWRERASHGWWAALNYRIQVVCEHLRWVTSTEAQLYLPQNSKIYLQNQNLNLCPRNDAARIKSRKENIRFVQNKNPQRRIFWKCLLQFEIFAFSRSICLPICHIFHAREYFGVLII
jgi:hypothetical protein